VVVGGGIPGVLQALLLAQAGYRVTIVERAAELGGLYSSAASPYGLLDRGIHLFYETGIDAIDRLVRAQLAPEEWIVLSDQRKDVAGNYFRGKLNEGSIFADARSLDPDDYHRALGEFFARLPDRAPQFGECENLADYFVRRFGHALYAKVCGPVASKVWKRDPALLSPWAARTVHMTRLVMLDNARSLALKRIPALDSLIAYPDQLGLPEEMLSNRLKAIYPRKFGTSAVVVALARALELAGVTIELRTEVIAMDKGAGQVRQIGIRGPAGGDRKIDADVLVWTTPVEPLAQLIGSATSRLPDRPITTHNVVLFLAGPPSMGELYYFYCFDPQFATFRVANFAAFCPAAAGSHGWPVSVEMHFEADRVPAPEALEELATSEALEMGVLRSRDLVRHVARLPAAAFFVPTTANVGVAAANHTSVQAGLPDNVVLTAPNLGSGSFYLHDALRTAHSKLGPWLED
jgi:protoporphyrinogen oxidase